MKKTLKAIGIIILTLLLFRGWIYRSTINYSEIGIRKEIQLTNPELQRLIDSKSTNKEIGFEEITDIALSITTNELRFSKSPESNNPNKLLKAKKANCIGYSSMFNTIANYLIRKNHLEGKIIATHKIGHLDFLGIDLHQFFESSFFKNHDFNEIKNLETGNGIFIDPSLSDYLGIKSIHSK